MITQSNQRGVIMNILITIRPTGDVYMATNSINDLVAYKDTHDDVLEHMCNTLSVSGIPSDIACDGVDSIYTFAM